MISRNMLTQYKMPILPIGKTTVDNGSIASDFIIPDFFYIYMYHIMIPLDSRIKRVSFVIKYVNETARVPAYYRDELKINRPKVLNERKYEKLSFYHGRSKSSVVIVFQFVETW